MPVGADAQSELDAVRRESSKEFNDRRDRRFRSLLQHHVSNPYNSAYRELLQAHHMHSVTDLPRTVAEMHALPPVTKGFLRAADHAANPAVPPDQVRITVLTSGSTGTPLSIPQSVGFTKRLQGGMFARSLAAVGRPHLCNMPGYAVCHYTDTIRNTGSYASSSDIQQMLAPNVILGVTSSPPEQHAAIVREHNIRWISGSPAFFISLAAWSRANGDVLRTSHLEIVHAAGAPMDRLTRARTAESLGLEVFHMGYASTELAFVGIAIEQDGPYSIFADEYIIEIVDEDGTHVAPGERGRVFVTVLACDAAPLIRYENGDTARFLGPSESCPNFPLIDQIGRTTTAFLADAKMTFEDMSELPQRMAAFGVPVNACQVVKKRHPDGRDQIVLRIECETHDEDTIKQAALQALSTHHQIDYHLRSNELAPALVEVFTNGSLAAGRFKFPIFVDETA